MELTAHHPGSGVWQALAIYLSANQYAFTRYLLQTVGDIRSGGQYGCVW